MAEQLPAEFTARNISFKRGGANIYSAQVGDVTIIIGEMGGFWFNCRGLQISKDLEAKTFETAAAEAFDECHLKASERWRAFDEAFKGGERVPARIRVTGCSKLNVWYERFIGCEYNISAVDEREYTISVGGHEWYVRKQDAEVVEWK